MDRSSWPKIICGNWKMNLGSSKARELANAIVEPASRASNTMVWVAPPFTSISSVQTVLKTTPIKVGAQNVHWDQSGPFTGEISPAMLKEEGVEFVIVGHSERRHVFGESDHMIELRLKSALSANLYSILCVGETEIERKEGASFDIVESQLQTALSGITERDLTYLIVAYEPVWAIGTGKVASIEQIGEMHAFINQKLDQLIGGKHTPILYGGSVNPDNYKEILSIDHVGGTLVGGASIVAEKFIRLIELSA